MNKKHNTQSSLVGFRWQTAGFTLVEVVGFRWQTAGFTLVEVMVGATLGLFLTAGVIQLFLASKQIYTMYENNSRMQENGRFALELLNNSIRMTNFTSCQLRNVTVDNMLNNKNIDWWSMFDQGWPDVLRGYDGTSNQEFPDPNYKFGTNQKQRISGTDAIISLGGSGNYSVAAVNAPKFTLTQLNKPNGDTLDQGDLVIVCNSTNTALFQVTSRNGMVISPENSAGFTPGNSTINLMGNYVASESTVVDYVPTAFYIGVSTSKETKSLYQLKLSVDNNVKATIDTQEMVEGVEDMQIFYGEDTDANDIPDAYVDATDVGNWSNVTSVRVYLLLVSLEDNVVSQPQNYFFPFDIGDSTISARIRLAPDRRLYQVVSTTIGIRNRLP